MELGATLGATKVLPFPRKPLSLSLFRSVFLRPRRPPDPRMFSGVLLPCDKSEVVQGVVSRIMVNMVDDHALGDLSVMGAPNRSME